MSEKRYTPGYIDVPGKGRRYRNASGEYFDNHFGSIVNSFGDAIAGIGEGYTNYYNATADAVGSERRDGTIKATKPTKSEKPAKSEDKPTYRSRREGLDAVTPSTTKYRSRREGLDAVYPDRKPNRTVTSPNSGNMPMNWAQYEEFLNKYGLNADEIESGKRNITLSGFESNNLPGGVKPSITTKPAVGISQAGASGEADINDQSRAHEVDQTKNRALPRGARQREMFLRQNPNYGQKETPKPDKGGLSARSKAFLFYDGKGGSLGAVRAADASQNLMRYGDRFAVKVGDGEYTEITREGADKIRSDMRDQKEFSQEFLSNYLATPAKPADAQSESAVQPKRATVDLDAMAEAYKPGYFPKELDFNVSYNDEIPDMGLDPKLFSLGIIGKRK